ncbi:P44/Msp2 family outer membrane protein [Candidatus Anaplasma sp. TIGMIC]|nr:P44/Msp2 family outer membrane protein [Candidatus Anaplasma sp. TIGMIC]
MRFRCDKKLISMTALALFTAIPVYQCMADTAYDSATNSAARGRVFVSLSYVPAFDGVAGFDINETNESTRAILPYMSDRRTQVLRTNNFDWAAMGTEITFGHSTDVALAGSIGLKIKSTRIELEVGHEMFTAQIPASQGARKREPGGYFVLPKIMAYDVINGNTARLGESLSIQSAEDIETFAHILHASHPEVDSLICKNGKKVIVQSNEQLVRSMLGLKDELGSNCDGKRDDALRLFYKTFPDPGLSVAVSNEGRGQWPKVSRRNTRKYSLVGAGHVTTDSSAKVAEDITDMGLDNRVVVAEHLAKTVEGGEVVEIRAVYSTSFVINACYDAEIGMSAVPYACVGFGGNLVDIADTITPKLAYKLKAGIAYRLSSSISAYLGGFFHHVLGDGQYAKLPVYKLVDDISPEGRTGNSAVAQFGLSYTGCEMGFRLMF